MSDARPLSVAVIIPTYGREQVLVDTIRQVLEQNPPADEVLVVDQTLEHEQAVSAYLAGQHETRRIRWIRHSPPNLPGARNRAAIETQCDLMLFIDDDVTLPEGFVDRHSRHFLDPTVTATLGQVFQDTTDIAGRPRRVGVVQSEAPGVHSYRFLVGGNFCVRRKAFIAVRGFDEHFVGSASFEENDFAWRLLDTGGRILFDPDAHLYHLRAPAGGCRTPGNHSMQEWKKTITPLIYAYRHVQSPVIRRQFLLRSLRLGPFRRENVVYPWRWPMAWTSWLYSLYRAPRDAAEPVLSPFAQRV